jgi:DNA-binding response OmpR family regulator
VKVLFLEPDRALANSIDIFMNQLRLKMTMKKIQTEEELIQEGTDLAAYSLFILNLKNPTDPAILKFIRQNGSDAPILLILEKEVNPHMLQTLYYLSYDDLIVKDFAPEVIAFRIYKLCHIWNDDVFCLSKEVCFDFKNALFIHKEEKTFLGKKEALFLKYMLAKSPHVVSFEEIECYVYHNEVISQERVRSLVRQLRAKLLPFHFIETVKGEGYKIVNTKIEEEVDSTSSTIMKFFLPLLPLADSSMCLFYM